MSELYSPEVSSNGSHTHPHLVVKEWSEKRRQVLFRSDRSPQDDRFEHVPPKEEFSWINSATAAKIVDLRSFLRLKGRKCEAGSLDDVLDQALAELKYTYKNERLRFCGLFVLQDGRKAPG